MQLRLLLLHPQRKGLHLRALQERHLQHTLRGCSPMSLRQYALQHPHRYALRASLGLFERGFFVYSCPARVRLIYPQKIARRLLLLGLIGAVFCAGPATPTGAPLYLRPGALCGRPLVWWGEPCVASADAAGSTRGIAIERFVCAACVCCRESAGWLRRERTDENVKW